METVKNIMLRRPTPQEQLREWQRRLRREVRNVDRQIRDIQREEKKVEKAIKEAAKRNDMGSARWMMPQHQMKDHHIKIMSILAEKDNAVHERNRALAEKKAALDERDMAILQRDTAIAERDTAIMERNNALAALECARAVSSTSTVCPPGCPSSRGYVKSLHNQHHVPHGHSPSQLAEPSYLQRDLPICEAAYPISSMPENGVKPRRKRQRKESKPLGAPSKKASKSVRKGGRRSAEDLNKQITVANWRGTDIAGSCKDLNKEGLSASQHEWKGHDLGLNHVTFDETTMPVPGCSCTGTLRQCYKWGNGGWQSACCTTTMSEYPLPQIPNKRHARIGGRKMSGGAFTKLLSRLSREGCDLSMPLDLKHHWAKHGTNRYITIK